MHWCYFSPRRVSCGLLVLISLAPTSLMAWSDVFVDEDPILDSTIFSIRGFGKIDLDCECMDLIQVIVACAPTENGLAGALAVTYLNGRYLGFDTLRMRVDKNPYVESEASGDQAVFDIDASKNLIPQFQEGSTLYIGGGGRNSSVSLSGFAKSWNKLIANVRDMECALINDPDAPAENTLIHDYLKRIVE